jgi:outer membrane protein OmpA-like peptidoglycan-associated protein
MKNCIRLVGVAMLFVLAAAADEWPRTEVFLGYNFVRFNPNSGFFPSFNANGGGGQFVFNFNRWLGVAFDAGAVNKGVLGGFDINTTVVNFVAGPRVTFHNRSRFVPFVQALFGGAYGTASTPLSGLPFEAGIPGAIPPGIALDPNLPVTARLNVSRTGFAMLAGGGLDIKLSRHVAFRPLEVDYYLMRVPSLLTGNVTNRNNVRYAAGVNFMLGGEQPTPAPPPPPIATKKCPNGTTVPVNQACPKMDLSLGITATATDICEGETVQVTAVAGNAPHNQLSYMWSVNGQPAGQQSSFTFNSTGKGPGAYHVAVKVNGNEFNPASAETTINVREYQPPTSTVQANPAEIHFGDMSTISANFTGQCGGPIQPPTFTASEGTIQGDQFTSASMQFDPNNKAEQRKTVTITAKAADNKSTGTATTTIDVVKEATPAAAIRLPDVLFPQNSSRVNNCGKRILLEQLRSYFERDPGGTVVLVGHSSSDETADIAQKRAQNAAAVITAGTGVCLAIPKTQVEVSWPGTEQNGVGFESGFCQSSVGAASVASQMRRVEVWFVPSGGKLPASVTNNQSASTLSLSGLGCPR